MNDKHSADRDELKVLASAAGLERVMTNFPEDLRSAFHAALEFRRGLGADLQPSQDIWLPTVRALRRD